MATFTSNGEPITQPSPQYDIPIVSNNGVVKYGAIGKNLFDKNNINLQNRNRSLANTKDGYWYYVESSTSLACRCLPNTQYTISGANSSTTIFRVATIDINTLPSEQDTNDIPYSYIYRAKQSEVHTFVTPSTAKWIIVQTSAATFDSTLNTIQIELGPTATAYEPYQAGIYTDGTTETVTVTGKNLFDKTDITTDKILNDTGAVVSQTNGYYSGHITVRPSTIYTVSQTNGVGVSLRVLEYDSTNTMVKLNKGTISGTQTKTFTTDANTDYVIVSGSSSGDALDTVQLELGSTATTYSPYFNGGSADAEMLLSVGDYKDTQEVLAGNVTRNVGIKVLDGTENWQTEYTGFFNVAFSNYIPAAPAYCNYFQTVTTGIIPTSEKRENKVWLGSTWLGLGARQRFSTIADFKQYLATQYANGTPVIVVYPLATATTETVTGQPLTIQEGTNIVEITQASIDNLGLEVSYKAGVKVTITEVQNSQLSNQVTVTIGG